MIGGPPIFPQQFAQQSIAPPQWPGQPAQPGWQQNPPLAAMAPGRGAPPAPAMVPMVPPIPAQAYDASGLPTGQPRMPAAPKGLRPAPTGLESKGLAANANNSRTPIYRGVAPESTPLVMPSPEQLGVTGSAGATAAAMIPVSMPTPLAAPTPRYSEETTTMAAVDWNATHARLRQLGVTGFHLDRVGEGFRVTCLIPASRTGQTHQIESEAVTEAAAVQFAIQRAETYAASR
jgi:hypothetical protein